MAEITVLGEMEFSHADAANIPVSIFLTQDNDSKVWTLVADNYMPRKGICSESVYRYTCADREPLAELIQRWVIPLYQGAVAQLQETVIDAHCKGLYYWNGASQAKEQNQ